MGRKSKSQIVYGGGWTTHETVGKPRARFFGFLSLIWLLVSFCVASLFWGGWPETFGYLEWVCGALLVPLPVFITLAGVFLLSEQPRTFRSLQPNPDYDIRKLH